MTNKSEKLIVGLTGTFGSGKSSVAQIFESLGAFVVDADKLAHEALEPDSEVFASIKELFGEALDPDSGRLDIPTMAGLVFNDPERKKRLESLVHPFVFKRIDEEIAKTDKAIVIVEVPLLFESGYDRECDQTLAVETPQAEIVARLQEKGFSEEEVLKRQNAQLPAEEKASRANKVVKNDQGLEQIKIKVEEIFNEYRSIKKK